MVHNSAGFLGLGNMGAGMACNLLKGVEKLYVYDVQVNATVSPMPLR